MHGSFGPLTFGLVNSPIGFADKQSIKLPEHPRIEDKPVLQWTGYDLDEVKITFRWDYYHTDPAAMLAQAQAILMAHEPYPLITVTEIKGTIYGLPYSGTDCFNREYVMQSLDTQVKKTDHSGRLIYIECAATLIECVQDMPAGGPGGGGGGGGGGWFSGGIGGFVSGLFG